MLKISFCEIWSFWSFFVQIRAFVIYTSLGLPNLNVKTKRILVVVIKWRHRANRNLSDVINLHVNGFFVISAQDCSFLNIDFIVIEKEHDYSDFCKPIHLQLTKVSFPG